VFVVTLAAAAAHVRVNITPSIPMGLYQDHAVSSRMTLPHGRFVLACPPLAAARLARARGYLGRGTCAGAVMPLGKHIMAHAGDTVTITATEVRVNGHVLANSRVAPTDHQGRPLVGVPVGTYVVSPNTVWLTGDSPDSWDSRYFGALPTSSILATMTPVWTVGPSSSGGS
jgi:conjugative transfer signal peptidase TraF